MTSVSNEEKRYDYIVVGAGAAGSVLAAELSTSSAQGFRKDPFGTRHIVRAAWAFGESTYRADYRAEFRVESRNWYWG